MGVVTDRALILMSKLDGWSSGRAARLSSPKEVETELVLQLDILAVEFEFGFGLEIVARGWVKPRASLTFLKVAWFAFRKFNVWLSGEGRWLERMIGSSSMYFRVLFYALPMLF